MDSVRITGFTPRQSAFHFPNSFAPEPVLKFGPLPIGNAANGLCGGMALAARDLFEAHRDPPPDTQAPRRGTAWFRYLVRRLFSSFNLPGGPLRYMLWMVLPTGDVWILHGVSRRGISHHWPKIRADLDQGRLSPLGLVRTKSLNPLHLARNHQVLAFGYDIDPAAGRLTIHVYDPNHPDDDGIALSLHVADPGRAGPIDYVQGELPVRGFFRTGYRFRSPPV